MHTSAGYRARLWRSAGLVSRGSFPVTSDLHAMTLMVRGSSASNHDTITSSRNLSRGSIALKTPILLCTLPRSRAAMPATFRTGRASKGLHSRDPCHQCRSFQRARLCRGSSMSCPPRERTESATLSDLSGGRTARINAGSLESLIHRLVSSLDLLGRRGYSATAHER